VGLPDASVKESKERVAAALHGMGYPLANQKVIINLSPSELMNTAKIIYHPCHLFYHSPPRNLPGYANAFTNGEYCGQIEPLVRRFEPLFAVN
jgi:predicted ATPase with chaperone activity